MTTFTAPELILGVPLYFPSDHNYFSVEEGSLPNGEAALIVRGDESPDYKAMIKAPVMSVDCLNISDHFPAGRSWAMSCWLRMSDLLASATGSIMLGCSTYAGTMAATFPDDRNLNFPLLLGPVGTNGYQIYRDPANNVASPTSAKGLRITNANQFSLFQNYWFLFIINVVTPTSASPVVTITTHFDSYDATWGTDSAGGGTAAFTYNPGRFLHLGAYHNGGTGRPDQWRIAKWAFHNNALDHAQRKSMWEAMYGTGPFVYTDDFNRASLGGIWKNNQGIGGFDIFGGQLRATGTLNGGMIYTRNLNTPNHYAQVEVVNDINSYVFPQVRVSPGAGHSLASHTYYSGGWQSASNVWQITRNGASIATSASSPPTAPHTVRVEVTTNGSGNPVIRVLNNGVLRLSFEDTNAAKLLGGYNAGIRMAGVTGTDQYADNFECGTL